MAGSLLSASTRASTSAVRRPEPSTPAHAAQKKATRAGVGPWVADVLDTFLGRSPLHSVDDLDGAVARADVVCTATMTRDPLVRGALLRPGTHLDLIGSFMPSMRESDAACFAGTHVFADTDEAVTKAGDLFTRITIGVAFVWIVLCMFTVKYLGGGTSLLDSTMGGGAQPAAGAAAGAGVHSPSPELASRA